MTMAETPGPSLSELLALARASCTLLTVSEVAMLANLTPWYVRQLISTGEIRAINVGGHGRRARWRIDPDDFRHWMAGRENRKRDLQAA